MAGLIRIVTILPVAVVAAFAAQINLLVVAITCPLSLALRL